MPVEPVAFWCYARHDNDASRGYLDRLRLALATEVRSQTGESFTIHQDREDLLWGQVWRERIDSLIGESSFLIPIVTPSFLKSVECLREMRQFMELESMHGRTDLIFPVYYIKCPLLESDDDPPPDLADVIEVLRERQRMLWHDFRRVSLTSQKAMERIDRHAEHLVAAMARSVAAPQGPPSTPTHSPTVGPDDDDRPGPLDHMAGIEEYLDELAETIGMVAELLPAINEITEEYAEKLQGTDKSSHKIAVFHAYAKALEGNVAELESVSDEYEDLLLRIEGPMTGVLSDAIIDMIASNEDRESYLDFLTQVSELPANIEGSIDSLDSLAETAAQIGRLSRAIRPTMGRIAAAVRKVTASRQNFDRWRHLALEARDRLT